MRKVVALSAALVLALALAGCGSSAASSSAASASASSSQALSTSDTKSSSASAASSAAATQTQASTKVDADGPNFDVEEFAKKHNLGEVTYFFLIPGIDGKEYWGIVTRNADGVEHVTHTDDAGNIIDDEDVPDAETPSAAVGYNTTTGYTGTTTGAATGTATGTATANANDGADFDVAAVANANNLGRYTHYFWVQGSDGKDYWGICAEGADGQESVTYTDASGNVIQGGDVPTATGTVPTGPNQQ